MSGRENLQEWQEAARFEANVEASQASPLAPFLLLALLPAVFRGWSWTRCLGRGFKQPVLSGRDPHSRCRDGRFGKDKGKRVRKLNVARNGFSLSAV